MKQIGVIAKHTGHIPPHTTVNLTATIELIHQARRNRLKVLEGALTVENTISEIISHYFFGQTHERKKVFEAVLLDSEACSFATKRRLIKHIIHEQNLLSGSRKNDFDDLMRKVVSWRNAFVHGNLSSDGLVVWLSYFEGGPKKKELTDEFLTEIESVLRKGYEACFQINLKMGITKMAEIEKPPNG